MTRTRLIDLLDREAAIIYDIEHLEKDIVDKLYEIDEVPMTADESKRANEKLEAARQSLDCSRKALTECRQSIRRYMHQLFE